MKAATFEFERLAVDPEAVKRVDGECANAESSLHEVGRFLISINLGHRRVEYRRFGRPQRRRFYNCILIEFVGRFRCDGLTGLDSRRLATCAVDHPCYESDLCGLIAFI